jgi:hypothetical protein
MSHIDRTSVKAWTVMEEFPDEIAFKPPLKRTEQKVDPHACRDEQDDFGKGHAR